MSARGESTEIVLAARLVSYSDALVAVSFLSVSGIGLAVADPDIRCTLAHGSNYVMAGNLVNGIIFTAIILMLRRWEAKLRADEPPNETAQRYMDILHIARLVILWVSVVTAMLLAAQTNDVQCDEEIERIGALGRVEAPACAQAQLEAGAAASISPGRAPVG